MGASWMAEGHTCPERVLGVWDPPDLPLERICLFSRGEFQWTWRPRLSAEAGWLAAPVAAAADMAPSRFLQGGVPTARRPAAQ